MNVQALKRKILDCGYNIVEFSDKVSIDRSTFYRRLEKDGNSFTIEEALRIKDVLSLTDAEAYSIFLSEKSQKWENKEVKLNERNKRRLSTNEKVQKKKSTLYEQGAKEEIKNI